MKVLSLAFLLFFISPTSIFAQDEELITTHGGDSMDIYSDGELNGLLSDTSAQVLLIEDWRRSKRIDELYDQLYDDEGVDSEGISDLRRDDEAPGWIKALAFISPVLIYLFSLIRAHRSKGSWDAGVFPKDLAFKPSNLMQAYIRLAALIIRADPRDSRQKIAFMTQFFKQKFPTNQIYWQTILKEAYEHPIEISTVTHWMQLHLKKKHERIQVLHFLVDVSFIDGVLNQRELNILADLAEALDLGPKELDSLIAMREDYIRDSKKERAKTAPHKNASERRLKRSSEILGVSIHAGLDEIKKAYRALAKLHHPDLFDNESAEQQRMAEERFVEVNKAYEYLVKLKFGV